MHRYQGPLGKWNSTKLTVDYKSNDCVVMVTSADYEEMARISMSYLLKYTDFDIVLYTEGYSSTISNPRIKIREFEFSDFSRSFHYMNCKPFISLDVINNSDYDRMIYFDCDMIFTEKVVDVFNDSKGYLETLPLYAPAPIPEPTWFVDEVDDGSWVKVNRMIHHYDFNERYFDDVWWWRMGHAYMFNKSCGNFFREIVDQLKTATSHPEQSKYMDKSGNWKFPINAEECYINTTMWKHSNSFYLPSHVQEVHDEKHYNWMCDPDELTRNSITKLTIPHPFHVDWAEYPHVEDPTDWIVRSFAQVPLTEGSRVEPISYHFSYAEISKLFMLHLHKELGGHDESIFNC